MGRRMQFDSRQGRNFFRHNDQTSSGTHPTSHLMDTGVTSSEVKRPEREVKESPKYSAGIKN
jgi:hypothetical protein